VFTEDFWKGSYKRAERMAYNFTQTPGQIEMLKSEAVIHLFNVHKKFKEGAATVDTWAYKVMWNRMLEIMRSQNKDASRFVCVEDDREEEDDQVCKSIYDCAPPTEFEDSQFDRFEMIDELRYCYVQIRMRCTPAQTRILDAVINHDTLNPSELAQLTGIRTSGSVNSHLHTIRQKVKELKNRGIDSGIFHPCKG